MSEDAPKIPTDSQMDALIAKVDKILGALFGSPEHEAPLVGRVNSLEKKQEHHGNRLLALEKSARNFGLVEKIVFGVIALALSGIALGLIKLVLSVPAPTP
jgi:hypothetical protein